MRSLRNTKVMGFSLIELMVVVAIIGILAAIAMPNFARFRAKSRQSEAKAHLAGIYMAQKSFFSEWGAYYSDLDVVGYNPEGAILYNAGFMNGDVVSGGLGMLTLAAPGVAGIPTGYAGPTTTGNVALSQVCSAMAMSSCIDGGVPALVAGDVVGAAPHAFLSEARTTGNLLGTAAAADAWTIDQNKTIQNTVNGVQ